mgnify:FL=1
MENKKRKIIGRTTFGIALILFGISLVIQTLFTLDILKYVLMLWPLIIISLGIEIIYYSNKNDIEVKYDFWGIILTGIVVFFGIIFSLFNYGVNKILYNDDVIQYLQTPNEDYIDYSFDSKLKITNMDDSTINIKIIEDEQCTETKVVMKYTLIPKTTDNVLALFENADSLYNYIDIDNLDSDIATLEILDIPSTFENTEIVIHTSSKDNILLTGNFHNL